MYDQLTQTPSLSALSVDPTDRDADMSPPYQPMVFVDNQTYWPEPYSLLELPPALLPGLATLGTLATVSVTALTALISFILFRLFTWKSHFMGFAGGSQCVILILNLLLADMQQSVALTISFHWLRQNSILAPSTPCTLQGWLLHSGDVSSGFFVLAIAVHTYFTTIHEREVKTRVFFSGIGMIWLFSFFLASVGVALHRYVRYDTWVRRGLTIGYERNELFVRAGPWCWISVAYEQDRLALHYVCKSHFATYHVAIKTYASASF